jgi:hypothetical protein
MHRALGPVKITENTIQCDKYEVDAEVIHVEHDDEIKRVSRVLIHFPNQPIQHTGLV